MWGADGFGVAAFGFVRIDVVAAPEPVDDLDGAVILQVPARCTLAVVEARAVVVAVAARQTMIEVTRGR